MKIVLQEQAFWMNRKETAQLTERKGIPICKMVLGEKPRNQSKSLTNYERNFEEFGRQASDGRLQEKRAV